MPCDESLVRKILSAGPLCHGTTSALGTAIVNGKQLLPRALTGVAVTDRTGRAYLDSNEDMIYFATVSAPVYATDLTIQARGRGEEVFPCVVEVEQSALDFGNLFPDEDYVARRLLKEQTGSVRDEARLSKLQAEVKANPGQHKEWLCDCLTSMGVVAHKGPIPLSAIVRITVTDDSDAFSFLSTAVDAMTHDQSSGDLNALERQLGPLFTRWMLGLPVIADEFPSAMRGARARVDRCLSIPPRVLYSRPTSSETTLIARCGDRLGDAVGMASASGGVLSGEQPCIDLVVAQIR